MSDKSIPSTPPLFSHRKWRHRRGYQRCVQYIGIDKNDDFYGGGFPLNCVIKFRLPVCRYTPRTWEIAKLLATLRILYGEEYMEELNALAEVEYLKMRRERKWVTYFGSEKE